MTTTGPEDRKWRSRSAGPKVIRNTQACTRESERPIEIGANESDLVETIDFFRDPDVAQDPYEYWEALRARGPIVHEPFHDVWMVTGYEEAVAIYHDQAAWSSCTAVTGPFPGFPVPLEGDDITQLIEDHREELPFSDQLPCLDPPKHTAHRALLMRLITPKR